MDQKCNALSCAVRGEEMSASVQQVFEEPPARSSSGEVASHNWSIERQNVPLALQLANLSGCAGLHLTQLTSP